jgi:serine/threonine protein kinase
MPNRSVDRENVRNGVAIAFGPRIDYSNEPDMPSLALMTIADRYQITGEPIGQGGMGIVYKAYDTVTRRHVALKTMRGALDAAALELFSKEWSVLSRLNHPNIVDIFDTGEFEEDGQRKPFFVMPFLPGRTFDYLIKNASQRLTVERVIEILLQTCRGLQAAHENGLIHRDLKPSNIFVMEDDTVKIIDFGVVHLAGSETVTSIKGTLQYMAPEQIDMKPTSPASDIFSLAIVCYEALTGRKPFARRNETETVEALRHHIPPPVCELNPLVSQLLSRVIHKAMAKAPYHRFSTAREFADTLQKAVNNQAIPGFDKSKTKPRIERAKKAQGEGDLQFASEVLCELEAEGHIDPEMTVLRLQINQAIRQKSIRQLLESARTRREEGEFLLALQKIQEVLDIDPENADALSLRSDIEKERGELQIENWFRLVDQHVHHDSFAQARQALQEILKLDSSNKKARELLVDVGRREQEINRLRAEKEQLYQAALSSYQNGEISSALSKLERVLEFSRTAPDSATPDRDAQYQGLYNQIRTERDAARNSLAEGRRCLADKNFDKALEICAEFLKRFPGDPLFQALRLEAEENRRQEHSSFIAEVARRAEAEPDLDRRVNILKEAAERYPKEAHFQQSLRLTRERRDLVNSIAAKARQCEDRGQFSEALGQWDILRNIYAQYPGIEFEIERLTRRRDEQVREEAKARWVEQIDRTRAAGDYSRARDLVRTAMAEFPEDRELAGLERLTRQDLDRAGEAETWLQRGQKLCFDREYGEGLEALRKAAVLDSLNPVIRAALLNALVEHARSVLGQDWRAAEPLIQQALGIDGDNPAAKSVQNLVREYKRKEIVNESVSQARELQAAGDLAGAVRIVEEALQSFPNESRLVQLLKTLLNLLPAARRAEAEISPAAARDDSRSAVAAVGASSFQTSEMSALDRSMDRTVLFPVQEEPRAKATDRAAANRGAVKPRRAGLSTRVASFGNGLGTRLQRLSSALPSFSRWQWGAIAAFPVIMLAAIIVRLIIGHPGPTPPPPLLPKSYSVNIQPDASSAECVVDNNPVSCGSVSLTPGEHIVLAKAIGYQTSKPETVKSAQTVPLHLEPELIRVRVSSDLKTGQVSLDAEPPVDLQEGGFLNERVSLTSEHKLTLTRSGKEYLSLTFRGEAGKLAVLSSPLKTNDLSAVVLSNLGPRSRVYSSNSALMAGVSSETPQPISPEGLELGNLKSGSEVVLVDAGNARPLPIDASNAPSLTLLLTSDPTTATVQISVNVPDTDITILGGKKPRHIHGTSTTYQLPPGKYVIRVTKDGYNGEDRPFELKKGEVAKLPPIELRPLVTVSTLVIDGGTPGAEILVDGAPAGTLRPDGSFSKSDIAPGDRSIVLRKADFEDKELKRSFSAGQSVRLAGDDARLTPFGVMTFHVTPNNAVVNYKREDETQNHSVANGGSVRLKAGGYSVSAAASGYASRSEGIAVSSGKTETIDWILEPVSEKKPPPPPPPTVPVPSPLPSLWTRSADGWDRPKGQGFAWWRTNEGRIELQIKHPKGKGPFRKHVEWVADWKDANRVEYSLDEKSLTRKVFVAGKSVETKDTVQMGSGEIWKLEISIQPDKIVIASNGKTLDEFKRPEPSAPLGKFGFKGDVELKQLNQ